MSEKVVLTKEQAEELKSMKKMGYNVEQWYRNKMNPKHPYSVIHDLSIDDFAKVFYSNDYEVENPKFRAGDKVLTVWENDNSFYTLEDFYPELSNPEEGKCWRLVGNDFGISEKNIRLATPEEIYWLETLGRDKVGDFRKGDVLMDEDGSSYSFDIQMPEKEIIQTYKDGDYFIGVFPVDSFKPFPREESK